MIRLATIWMSVLALAFSGMAGLPSCLLADTVFGTEVCPCSRACRFALMEHADAADGSTDLAAAPPACPFCHHPAEPQPVPTAPGNPANPADNDGDQPGHDRGSCVFSHGQPIISPSASVEVGDLPCVWSPFQDRESTTCLLSVHTRAATPERGPPANGLADGITLPLLT